MHFGIPGAHRLRNCVIAAILACSTPGHRLHAQTWPEKAVRIVVPSPSGSGIDVVARAFAQRLAIEWGGPVAVENRAGANSIIGTEFVARSAPDGHTLLFASDSTFTLNPHIYAKLPYDPVADFKPLVQVATFHQLLVAHPSLQADTVSELIALAKRSPGAITYASWGAGSQGHLLSELLKRRTEIDLLHVPYKGFAPALAAVLAGETKLTWAGVFSTVPLAKAGRIRALGIAGPARSSFFPDVPTFAELGLPDVDYTLWFGFFAPATIRDELATRIAADIGKLLQDPQLRRNELIARGYEPSGAGPRAFASSIASELQRRAAITRIAGVIPQ